MEKRFIPIEVTNDSNWYMDITNLSLSEIIALKDSLRGTDSIRALDSRIYELSGITYESYNNLSKRQQLRNKETYCKTKKFNKNKFKKR